MKNNKYITYLLMAIVLGTFGITGYRLFRDLSGDNIPAHLSQTNSFNAPKPVEKEKFDLLPVNKDPFLGTRYTSKTKVKKTTSKKKEALVWPQIVYKGIVNGQRQNSYIVQVNGQDYVLSKGEEINEVKLLSGNSKNVRLRYKNSTKEYDLQ